MKTNETNPLKKFSGMLAFTRAMIAKAVFAQY